MAVTLNNGMKMPVIGIGTFQAKDDVVRCTVKTALECGYRHIDTASMYRNEEAIGDVLHEWLSSGRIKREDLFVTTKLPMIANRAADVTRFLDKSLANLQLSYVDLYLIHFPVGFHGKDDDDLVPRDHDDEVNFDMETDLESLYKAMEEQVDSGKAKSIGVSNFDCGQIERILKVCRIRPVNHQIEMHAYYPQKKMMEFCRSHEISICAFAPLGAPYKVQGSNNFSMLLEDAIVTSMATRLTRTPAQILLRHLIQLGVIVIPKSSKPERIQENFQVFDFELSSSDMDILEKLDQGPNGYMFDFRAFKGVEKHHEYKFKRPSS